MKTILCYGDSNTHGFVPGSQGDRHPYNVRWTGRLQEILGDDVRIIEEGLNGRTTVWPDPIEGDYKSGKSYLIPCLDSHKPIDIVVLMLGSNDLKVRFGLGVGDIAMACGTLIDMIKTNMPLMQGYAPKVLLVSPLHILEDVSKAAVLRDMFDGDNSAARSKEFAHYYSRTAKLHGAEFWDASKHVSPSPLDNVHMDADGHNAFAIGIAEKLEEMLQK